MTQPTNAQRKRLFDLTDELLDIYNLIDDAEGVVTDELYEILMEGEGSYESKLERIAVVIKDLKQDQAKYKALALPFQEEADRLRARAKGFETAETNLKARLKTSMEVLKKTRVETGSFVISIQGNGGREAVEWKGGAWEIPIEFAIEPQFSADLYWQWKAANPEAELPDEIADKIVIHERGTHVRIR